MQKVLLCVKKILHTKIIYGFSFPHKIYSMQVKKILFFYLTNLTFFAYFFTIRPTGGIKISSNS